MRKKNYKGRCEKRKLDKCQGVCKTYDDIQYAYKNENYMEMFLTNKCAEVAYNPDDVTTVYQKQIT